MTTATALTAIDVLQQARDLLTPIDSWTKGEWVERTWDEETNDFSEKVQACSMGAMLLAEGMEDVGFSTESAVDNLFNSDKAFRKATKALAKAIRKDLEYRAHDDIYEEKSYVNYVVCFNDDDDTTHADVLKAFDAGIARLKK